jgi:hypothetical protein
MSGNIPVEPSSDIRIAASQLRQIYIALMQEGFTTQEALTIIGQILATNQGGTS